MIIMNSNNMHYFDYSSLTYFNIQLEGYKKSSCRCSCTLCYAREISFINFSKISDGKFALCLQNSRQFSGAESISCSCDHTVPKKLVDD